MTLDRAEDQAGSTLTSHPRQRQPFTVCSSTDARAQSGSGSTPFFNAPPLGRRSQPASGQSSATSLNPPKHQPAACLHVPSTGPCVTVGNLVSSCVYCSKREISLPTTTPRQYGARHSPSRKQPSRLLPKSFPDAAAQQRVRNRVRALTRSHGALVLGVGCAPRMDPDVLVEP